MVNSTFSLKDGYDIPLYGISDGTFYGIHIPAIICIVTSFTCAALTIVLSFRSKTYRTFFSRWSKNDRIVVYSAICDGLFNIAHFTDHMHIVIARSHVYPTGLCTFYAFTLAEFITAQILMMNIVAINAFVLVRWDKNINFGSRDWHLLLWTFGAPFVGATIAGGLGQFGPNGSFCYFDAVKGSNGHIWFSTVPVVLTLAINTVLYVLTWLRIRQQTAIISKTLGTLSATQKASISSAKAMSLFVAAFIIQWGPMSLFGLWSMFVTEVPQPLHHIIVVFTNTGGVLNLIVFLIIRRRQLKVGNSNRRINPTAAHASGSNQRAVENNENKNKANMDVLSPTSNA